MIRVAFSGAVMMIALLRMTESFAQARSDVALLVAAVRDLFPEIDSETFLEDSTQPAARLTAKVSYENARERVRQASDSARVLAGGVRLGVPVERQREVSVTVEGRGGVMLGSLTIEKRMGGITINVHVSASRGQAPKRPPSRVLPKPIMWLFTSGVKR